MHEIVALTKPSEEQKPAIEARNGDVVVVAGAGAGKTRTLVARYLALLAEVEEHDPRPQQIVAITFTKKAAREMRNRVREFMRRYIEPLAADDQQRTRWDKLYSDLDAARIGTIHSLCAELLQAHPAEAGIDPRFTVLTEALTEILQAEAVAEALALAARDPVLATLFPLLGEHLLQACLQSLLARRLDAQRILARAVVPLAVHLERRTVALTKECDPALDRALEAALPHLRTLFQHACDEYAARKRERQALDFDDLEAYALDLLKKNKSVARRWQNELRAILVDEYQDTNQRQRELIAQLNAGGRLFIVGDAKQSIYRFRGANVAVFQEERERIEGTFNQAFNLETSYRAHAGLVALLNSVLARVLGAARDTQIGIEPFAPLVAHRAEAARGFEAPHIELHLALGAKADGAGVCAARALAARIVALVEERRHFVRVGEGHERALEYGDIAILCRSSGAFAEYEDALDEAGVPYLTVAGRGFYGRPEVRDVLNALAAIADPTQDVALVGLLRSPVFALPDAVLYRACAYRDTRWRGRSLWEALAEAPVGDAITEEVRAAYALIAELHAMSGRQTVADLLKVFLERTHYLAALRLAGAPRAVRNVLKLLADAHAAGIPAVGEFLLYLEAVRDTGAREGEARATVEGAVQLMTIHAAKGLEFPVVVLGNANYDGRTRTDVLLDETLGLLVPLTREGEKKPLKPVLYQAGHARAKAAEEAEEQRLLYVAATRAQEKLIISGSVSITKNKNWSARGWLKDLAAAGLDFRVFPVPAPGEQATHTWEVDGQPVACVFYPLDLAAGQARAETRALELSGAPVAELLAPLTAAVPSVDFAPVRPPRVWRVVPTVARPHAPQHVIGVLVHAALAAWRFPDTGQAYTQWARTQARTLGVTDERQLVDAARASAKLLMRFRAHALCAEMEGAPRRYAEMPYSVLADGRLDSGVIDALYERGEQWTIIEYKTDAVRRVDDLASLLAHEDYVPQVRRYAHAVQTLLGVAPRCVLCFLDVAGRVQLHGVQ